MERLPRLSILGIFLRVSGLRFRVSGSRFGVSGLGFRVSGLGFWVRVFFSLKALEVKGSEALSLVFGSGSGPGL